jgi:HD-GYP domain-containing protein (c-di-GMP phosphodiesterase class II)
MALKRKFFKTNHVLSSFITAFTNRVIAREGDIFNKKLLDRAAKLAVKDLKRIQIKDTFLYPNFVSLLEKEKYQFITDFGVISENILNLLGHIELNEKILDELAWMRDNYIYNYHHTIASSALSTRLALDYFMDEDVAMEVAESSLVKDIGFGHIAKDVVNKTGRLSKREQLLLQEHPMYSALLIAHYYGEYKILPVEIALNHHEDKLGQGYPRGVIAGRIELHIVKFADTFDALITARPFRSYFDLEDAFMISEAEIKLGNLDASLLPLIRSYHINFKTFFNKDEKMALL